jgi:hypothetical protein
VPLFQPLPETSLKVRSYSPLLTITLYASLFGSCLMGKVDLFSSADNRFVGTDQGDVFLGRVFWNQAH